MCEEGGGLVRASPARASGAAEQAELRARPSPARRPAQPAGPVEALRGSERRKLPHQLLRHSGAAFGGGKQAAFCHLRGLCATAITGRGALGGAVEILQVQRGCGGGGGRSVRKSSARLGWTGAERSVTQEAAAPRKTCGGGGLGPGLVGGQQQGPSRRLPALLPLGLLSPASAGASQLAVRGTFCRALRCLSTPHHTLNPS